MRVDFVASNKNGDLVYIIRQQWQASCIMRCSAWRSVLIMSFPFLKQHHYESLSTDLLLPSFVLKGDHQRHQPGPDASQHQSLHPHDPTGIRIYAPTLGPAQGRTSYVNMQTCIFSSSREPRAWILLFCCVFRIWSPIICCWTVTECWSWLISVWPKLLEAPTESILIK